MSPDCQRSTDLIQTVCQGHFFSIFKSLPYVTALYHLSYHCMVYHNFDSKAQSAY